MNEDGFAALGRQARQEGLGDALEQPLEVLLDSDVLSRPQLRTIERAAQAMGLRTVGDLCRPEVDAFVDQAFGARSLCSAAYAVGGWLSRRDDGEEAFDDLDSAQVPDDLFAAQAVRLASASQGRPTALPSTAPELRRWAEDKGVLERLADPAQFPQIGANAAGHGAPATVEEVLTAEVPKGRRSGDAHWWERLRREAATAYLLRVAENLAFIREHRDQPASRVDPALAALDQALRTTRAALAQETAVAARPEGAVIPAPLLFRDEPPRLVYDEGANPRDPLIVGYREPALVQIELAGWQSAGVSVRCRCADAGRGCPHRLAALDAAAELLRTPSSPAHRPLLDWVSTPAWTRFLARLDRALAALPSRSAGSEERLIWKIGADRGGAPSLEPQRQTRTARGAWSRGTRLSVRQLAGKPGLLASAADGRAVEILTEGTEAGMYVPFSAVAGRIWRAVEALAGAPNVFLADRRDAPAAIQVLSPRLRFCRPDGAEKEGAVLRVALGELLVDPADLLAGASDGRHYIGSDPAANVCRLARLEPELAAVARSLSKEPAPFPDEALPEVLRRMERVERVAGLDLPPELRGTVVEADERLVCRLTPLADDGLRLEMRVRPVAGADDYPPGEGPRVVVARRDGERVSAERTLEREREAASQLAAAIGLADAAPARPGVFEVVDRSAAFDLFLALQERAGAEVIEWPAEAWRIEQVRRSALRLRVTERRDWFGLEGGVEVGGQLVPLQDLLEAIRRGRRYVVLGPRRFALIEEELRARLAGAQDLLHQGRGGIEMGGPAAQAVAELVEDPGALESVPSFQALREGLLRAARRQPVLPEGLRATLRPYQLEGFRWLSRLAAGGAGALLADDMGLGKTVQVLAVLLERAGQGPALVIAPTSVVPNWIAEAARFAPDLRPILYRGADRSASLAALGPGQLVVTSYAVAVRDAEALKAVRFTSLVLDEAQALKNAATRRSRAIRELQSDWRVALTGTPIENHLGELWSLFRIVSPALFGSWDQFRERFALPIERQADGERRQALGRLLRPFLLRRTKEAVAPELPAKTEVQRLVDLSAGERRLYEETRVAALAQLSGATSEKEGQARIQILAALTRLRQLACHPALGDAASALPSSKVRALIEVLGEVREAGHRALVFSQFTRFLELVRRELSAEGFALLTLDGSTPAETREARVAAFQRGEADVFLISLRAGGTGLNLTAADYIIHLDPWWNPAVEDQATDRAHRIGQTRAVTVVRMIARGTVEEAVLALHEEKRGLAASILDGTDTAARLGAEELLALLRAHADADAIEDSGEVDAEAPSGENESSPGSQEEPASPPADLPLIDSLITEALAPFHPSGNRAPATYRSYQRSLAGFRAFVEERRPGATVDECIEAYLGALVSGTWPAPPSAPGVARITLGHLRRAAAARWKGSTSGNSARRRPDSGIDKVLL